MIDLAKIEQQCKATLARHGMTPAQAMERLAMERERVRLHNETTGDYQYETLDDAATQPDKPRRRSRADATSE